MTVKLPQRAGGRTATVKARFGASGSLLARTAPERKLTVKR